MSFVFDPFDYKTFQPDPWPILAELREDHPVYHNAGRGFWALSRFEDVQAAARDWQTFSSADGVNLDDIAEVEGPGNFLDMDPPRHDQLRDVVRRWFSPRALRELEPVISAKTDALLDKIVAQGHGDLAQEFAWPLPVGMISHILGFPEDHLPQLVEWAQVMIVRESGTLKVPKSVRDVGRELHRYFGAAVEDRRRSPRADVISSIATASVDGSPLTDEVMGMSMVLFGAGTETTASLIGNALLLLAQHPEQRRKLVARPELMEAAIEEILRYEPSAPFLARTTTAPVTLHGQEIPTGARVLLVFAAANRDPRRWTDPDRLDIEREGQRTLAFGVGIHHCIGAPLARPEARIAVARVLERMPNYSLVGEAVRSPTYTTLRNLTNLPALTNEVSGAGEATA